MGIEIIYLTHSYKLWNHVQESLNLTVKQIVDTWYLLFSFFRVLFLEKLKNKKIMERLNESIFLSFGTNGWPLRVGMQIIDHFPNEKSVL